MRGRKDARQHRLRSGGKSNGVSSHYHHFPHNSTDSMSGLRSELCEIAQTVYAEFNRDERLQYDH